MKKAIITIGLVVLLVGGSASAVENKDFYSDGNIMTGEQWNVVNIYDTPPDHTTVNMLGGLVDVLKPHNASTFNMTFGEIYTLSAWEFSTVNASGGFINGLGAYENAGVSFFGSASAFALGASDFGIVTVLGGTITNLDGLGSSTINLYGGAVTDHLGAGDFSTVNIFGYDLVKTSSGGRYGYGQVYGFFNDGTSFTIDLSGSETYSHINLIPEPATILLLGLGVLIARKRT